MLKVGDRASFIDERQEGTVLRINGAMYLLQLEDGFEEWVSSDRLIKKQQLDVDSVMNKDRVNKKPNRTGKRTIGIIEKDLHIHELLRSTRGLSNHDMVEIQLTEVEKTIEKAQRGNIKKVILIHGVGEGKLRSEIHRLLDRKSGLEYFDADFTKYGAGATEVNIW